MSTASTFRPSLIVRDLALRASVHRCGVRQFARAARIDVCHRSRGHTPFGDGFAQRDARSGVAHFDALHVETTLARAHPRWHALC